MTKPKNKTMKLPGKYVEFCDLPIFRGKKGKCTQVALSDDESIVLDLGGNRWSYFSRSYRSMTGYIGGYNQSACKIAYALAELGFWHEKEADEFVRWFNSEECRISDESKLENATRVAHEFGYVLVKQEVKK